MKGRKGGERDRKGRKGGKGKGGKMMGVGKGCMMAVEGDGRPW